MPVAALKSHFGVSGEWLQGFARGIDERKVEPPGEAKSISRETTFPDDIRNRPRLEATLRYLGDRVGNELRESDKQARWVTLKLRYADFTTITRSRTLEQPFYTDETIFENGLELLRKVLAHEKRPVRLIGIGVSQLSEPASQLSLWDSSTLKAGQLNRAIDRIRRKYGFSAIQTGRTMLLKELFSSGHDGYKLHTPGLSR